MAISIDSVMNNGHEPRMGELRDLCARLRIRGYRTFTKRHEFVAAIARYEEEVAELRRQCAENGLSTEGEKSDLELRLVQNSAEATTKVHRRSYYTSVTLGVLLGLAGLAISVPHMSAELSKLMNIEVVYGVLFAVIIDGGFIVMKVVDSLNNKFEFSRLQRVTIWATMVICLVMSAALNASNFLRHAESGREALAVSLACFMSLFVFAMFYIASSMIMSCQNKKIVKGKDVDPAVKLEQMAADLRRLRDLPN